MGSWAKGVKKSCLPLRPRRNYKNALDALEGGAADPFFDRLLQRRLGRSRFPKALVRLSARAGLLELFDCGRAEEEAPPLSACRGRSKIRSGRRSGSRNRNRNRGPQVSLIVRVPTAVVCPGPAHETRKEGRKEGRKEKRKNERTNERTNERKKERKKEWKEARERESGELETVLTKSEGGGRRAQNVLFLGE